LVGQAHSISTRRRYGTALVCRIWGVSQATAYRRRDRRKAANDAGPPRRRGPEGACSDSALLEHIRAILEASPFSGEGYRKVWARLRAVGVRTAARRARRIMKENNLLAPQRPVQRDAHPHDGTIVTERVDQVWGTDMSGRIGAPGQAKPGGRFSLQDAQRSAMPATPDVLDAGPEGEASIAAIPDVRAHAPWPLHPS